MPHIINYPDMNIILQMQSHVKKICENKEKNVFFILNFVWHLPDSHQGQFSLVCLRIIGSRGGGWGGGGGAPPPPPAHTHPHPFRPVDN